MRFPPVTIHAQHSSARASPLRSAPISCEKQILKGQVPPTLLKGALAHSVSAVCFPCRGHSCIRRHVCFTLYCFRLRVMCVTSGARTSWRSPAMPFKLCQGRESAARGTQIVVCAEVAKSCSTDDVTMEDEEIERRRCDPV